MARLFDDAAIKLQATGDGATLITAGDLMLPRCYSNGFD